jgi:murein DD-endopeptidase MepM/ murein hydrolase activator NlpD
MAHRILLVTLILCLAPSLPEGAPSGTDRTVRVHQVKVGNEDFLCASNDDPYAPQHVQVEVQERVNLEFLGPQPIRAVLPPQGTVTLGRLKVVDPMASVRFRFSSTFRFGDPEAVPDKDFAYLFPYGHGVKHGLVQGYMGNATHRSCYCLDFDLSEGSPIHAAREGLVLKVKQDSSVGGPSPAFRERNNEIWILHSDGTLAQYGHLQKNGARVGSGQKVTAGQMIGLSGHTGQASGPHLHFQVSQATWEEGERTLPTKFLGKDGTLVSPEEGKFYYSYHPDGKPFQEVKADDLNEDRLDQAEEEVPLNGAVTVLTKVLDDRTLFYGSNGKKKGITLTLSFAQMENYASSKPLPFTRTIPPGKSVYLLNLKRTHTLEKTRFRYGYQWR